MMGQLSSIFSREDDDPWFQADLRTREYHDFGDAYEDDRYTDLCRDWNVDAGDKPYLAFVKQIKDQWPHLRLLADFMQIGTHPMRWKHLNQQTADALAEREARVHKIKICRLDYYSTGNIDPATFDSQQNADAGRNLADELELEITNTDIQFRLYVVEDLSRDMIEILGSKLGIEPSFFRAHIVDYAWYNVRDRWREPPSLDIVSRQQNWIQLRYVTARYFKTKEEFDNAVTEAKDFNIWRRPDDDVSNNAWWDSKEAIVGLTRSRATFWLKPRNAEDRTAIGVLLLDPTVGSGVPLWRGRRNWHPTPHPSSGLHTLNLTFPEPLNFYTDFLFWAQKPDAFSSFSSGSTSSRHHIPIQALLHLVASEWRTMTDYINTRLCQIQLEIFKPKKFAVDRHVDEALGKLNAWRRFVPLYREMVTEVLEKVFNFPCHTETFSSSINGNIPEEAPLRDQPGPRDPPPAQIADEVRGGMEVGRDSTSASTSGNSQQSRRPSTRQLGSIAAYRNDFVLILSHLEEYQKRIDRLTSVVTSSIQIENSRVQIGDARNLGRLTWLATVFIPFSLVATIFCIQDVTKITGESVRIYFASSVPLAVVTIFVAWVLFYHPIAKAKKLIGFTKPKRSSNPTAGGR